VSAPHPLPGPRGEELRRASARLLEDAVAKVEAGQSPEAAADDLDWALARLHDVSRWDAGEVRRVLLEETLPAWDPGLALRQDGLHLRVLGWGCPSPARCAAAHALLAAALRRMVPEEFREAAVEGSSGGPGRCVLRIRLAPSPPQRRSGALFRRVMGAVRGARLDRTR
jgi:hypothetical protein